MQSSVILRTYEQDNAIKYAISADSLYNKVKRNSISNKVYTLLNLAECYSYKKQQISKSINLAHKALHYAKATKDSDVIADVYQDLSVFYEIKGSDSTLVAAKKSFSFNTSKDASSCYTLCNAYVQFDSLEQAKDILYHVSRESLVRHGYEFFSLLKQIALMEKDYNKVSEYADSSTYYLEKENAENLQAKDQYYQILTKKEIQSAQYHSESKWKTKLVIITITLSLIIIMCLIYAYKQRREKDRERAESERRKHELEISNKEIQINTMRDFLVRKVDIINKLESLKSNGKRKLILSEEDWEEIEIFLNNTDEDFVIKLHRSFPNLTTKDLRFMMLLRLRLPNSSLAVIYNIEEKSIRQNLFLIKKKLKIEGKNTSARRFIEDF